MPSASSAGQRFLDDGEMVAADPVDRDGMAGQPRPAEIARQARPCRQGVRHPDMDRNGDARRLEAAQGRKVGPEHAQHAGDLIAPDAPPNAPVAVSR